MTATATETVKTTVTINDVRGIDVYTKPNGLRSYHLAGHSTGWRKRDGARTAYAELTCTCHLTGEAVAYPAAEGQNTWISYGEEGWIDRLNAAALAHVENVTNHGILVRKAGGDRSRWADRTRTNMAGLIVALAADFGPDEVAAKVAEVLAGRVAHDSAGNRYELASDRSPHAMERLAVR